MNYFDKYNRVHNKPVTLEAPIPSNNSWIFTAYLTEVDGKSRNLKGCFDLCCVEGKFVKRSPEKFNIPMSRDEVLGATALGLLKPGHLNDWNFSPFPLPRFSPTKLVKQLWELRPRLLAKKYITLFEFFGGNYIKLPLGINIAYKHRNYFWQNNLDQLYRFAFSVPVQDRYFILKKWGKFRFYKPSHLFYAAVAKVDSLMPKKSGIKFLKYGGEKNKAAMVKDFPDDHPIVLAVKGE